MLGNYNKTVLVVASVLLIFGLVIIGFFITSTQKNSTYPPVIGDCPDYWDVGYDSNKKKICTNRRSINSGLASPPAAAADDCRAYPVALFSASGTSDNDIICEKNKWAKRCNIHWDGITNNSQACLRTTMQ
jgi:hypothetical protein